MADTEECDWKTPAAAAKFTYEQLRERGADLLGGTGMFSLQLAFERYGKEVAAAEREACAKLIEAEPAISLRRDLAAKMRARGES